VPLASATLIVRGGAGLDAPGQAGLSKLAAEVSLLGCGHTARDVSAGFDALGLSAASRVEPGTSRLTFTGLSASLPQGLGLMARCVQAATPEGLGLQRLIRELGQTSDDPGRDVDRVADAAFDRLEYGAAGRDRRPPRMHELGAVTPAQLDERRRRLFHPNGAVLVLTGAIDPASALHLAAQMFGDWPAQDAPAAAGRRTASATGAGPLVVDAPGYPLALVAVGARTPGHGDPARLAFELADSALGGSFTSRLSEALRGQRSLTYDVGSQIDWGQADGRFSARTEVDPAVAPEVAALMLQEIRSLARTGPGADELARQKALVAAQLADATETTADLADLLADQAARGEPLTDAFDDARRLTAVTGPEVRAAAERLADPANAQVVIVADVRRLPASFRRQLPPGALVKADALVDAHR
jgi:zinc protease